MTASPEQSLREWVPVEHRRFGLDRRTFKPGLIALGVALVLIYGLQGLNAAIPWRNEIQAGQVLDLGAGATAVPPVGWQLESGTLTGGSGASATNLQVLLASGGARIELIGTTYNGSAVAFLEQVLRSQGDSPQVSAGRGTLTTDAGLVGVVESRTGPTGDGTDVAFKMAVGDSQAVDAAPALLVRVRTAAGQLDRYQNEVDALLRSIKPGVAR
ncbi:hypothetical protein [Streptomyces sp. SID13031]|uniref:hypothetical protein n=1 Tax=Streptomyces sp. SID13031 TaxID=2706046 RepID=UPI0013C9F913|nr:hypothetical protein [Streptomyces sp. SID13031]NEA36616.1 hypothetical protein [Streptomyces sp. SID13031]